MVNGVNIPNFSVKYLLLLFSLQHEIIAYLSIEHKPTGFTKLADMSGNGEFSTKKNPDMDGYGSG